MKVLHVGHGFYPWRRGGSLDHALALMNMQINKGMQVYYFFSGRVYPFGEKPELKKWKNNSINFYELINSPLISLQGDGVSNPQAYINNKDIQRIFSELIEEINPDIVHIQELISLPSSLIDIVKDKFKIPLIITLHDYSMLCPTIKLFKYDNTNCSTQKIGLECCKCSNNAPQNNNMVIGATIAYHLEKIHIPSNNLYNLFLKLHNTLVPSETQKLKPVECKNPHLKDVYQERRDLNIKRLEKADLIIAHSNGQRKVLSNFIDSDKIKTIHPAAQHLKKIKMNKKSDTNYPLKFGTLNGCLSVEKGSKLVLDTLKILNRKGLKNKYNFHIWGSMNRDNYSDFLKLDNVHYHGRYDVNDLNQILENVDVGLVPSVWEEVYGFVGIEFLKKGIPVIGNKRGGIPEYVIENSTGWLNKSVTSEELATIMQGIIENPDKIVELNNNISKIKFKTVEENFNEINSLYTHLLQKS